MPRKKKEDDLYSLKRKMLKEKRMLRNSILGTDTVDGSSMQRLYGESTKTRRALKIELFQSRSKSSKYGDDTSIEKFVYEFLKEQNINFIAQKAIRYTNVDAFLPDYKAVLQLHGTYWHSDPRFYPREKLNNIQVKNIEKDKIANQHVEEAGYHLIEIWENEIKNKPDLVKEKLLEVLTFLQNQTTQTTISSIDW